MAMANARKKILRIRFSDSEFDRLETLARESGLTMSELVRDHLDRIQIRNRSDEKARISMLNRINANLNMIARWVNRYRNAADSVEVISHLLAIEREIERVAK
jgi:hypothetical protein